MPDGRATWPRWARNAFILQLALNCAFVILLLVLFVVGQANNRAKIASLERDLAAQQKTLADAETKLRDWWAIDTRNLREAVRKDTEALLEEERKANLQEGE